MVIKIGISGINGRMGRTILDLVAAADDLAIAGGVENPASEAVGTALPCGAGEETVKISGTVDFKTDVLIDFSSPAGTKKNLELAAQGQFAMVIGTTGLGKEHDALLARAAKKTAVLAAPNMSVGMNLLFDLVRQTAARLGHRFDVEIVETHHRHKKDAPSGSALRILKMVQEGHGSDVGPVAHGREGMPGERKQGEIALHAVRGGDVVGDHQVLFAGAGERIELIHRASSRECFARGAIEAARFVAAAPPGQYGMADVLEFLESQSGG